MVNKPYCMVRRKVGKRYHDKIRLLGMRGLDMNISTHLCFVSTMEFILYEMRGIHKMACSHIHKIISCNQRYIVNTKQHF